MDEDDFEQWFDEAMSHVQPASRTGRPGAASAGTSTIECVDLTGDEVVPVRSDPAAAGSSLTPNQTLRNDTIRKRASALRIRRLDQATSRPVSAGIVPFSVFTERVARTSTERLMKFKAQLDRVDRDALLSLPADIRVEHVARLLESSQMTLDASLPAKSVMDCAYNLIFYTVCSRHPSTPGKPPYKRHATVDEVVDHLDRIAALPVERRDEIRSLLDITRSLLASDTNLASTFEVVRRAVFQRPSFIKLPART